MSIHPSQAAASAKINMLLLVVSTHAAAGAEIDARDIVSAANQTEL